MKTTKKTILLASIFAAMLLMLVMVGCTSQSSDNPWLSSWKAASEKADETGKNILIFFSNIGEDSKSQEINNYFSKPKVVKKISKDYVLLNLDYNSKNEQMEYQDLMDFYDLVQRFSVQSIPEIIIATPEGYVIGAVTQGDIEQSASKIFSKVKSYEKASKEVTKVRKELEACSEDNRIFVIDKLVSNLDETYRYLVVDLLSEIRENDPDNEKGLYNNYLMDFAYSDALELFNSGDVEGAIDVFLKLAETEGVKNKDVQEAYETASYLMTQSGLYEPEVVLENLQKSLAADPKSKNAESIKNIIKYMEENLIDNEDENSGLVDENDNNSVESDDNSNSDDSSEKLSDEESK